MEENKKREDQDSEVTWIDEWLDSDESLKYIKEYFEKREFRDDFPGVKSPEK